MHCKFMVQGCSRVDHQSKMQCAAMHPSCAVGDEHFWLFGGNFPTRMMILCALKSSRMSLVLLGVQGYWILSSAMLPVCDQYHGWKVVVCSVGVDVIFFPSFSLLFQRDVHETGLVRNQHEATAAKRNLPELRARLDCLTIPTCASWLRLFHVVGHILGEAGKGGNESMGVRYSYRTEFTFYVDLDSPDKVEDSKGDISEWGRQHQFCFILVVPKGVTNHVSLTYRGSTHHCSIRLLHFHNLISSLLLETGSIRGT